MTRTSIPAVLVGGPVDGRTIDAREPRVEVEVPTPEGIEPHYYGVTSEYLGARVVFRHTHISTESEIVDAFDPARQIDRLAAHG